METTYRYEPNRGSRVLPIPITLAAVVDTHDWQGSTSTLRRPTDKQRVTMLGRCDWFGVGRSGPHVRMDCLPVVAVLADVDMWALMPLSA